MEEDAPQEGRADKEPKRWPVETRTLFNGSVTCWVTKRLEAWMFTITSMDAAWLTKRPGRVAASLEGSTAAAQP